MAQKRSANKWLLLIVSVSVVLFLLMMCSEPKETYQSMPELPSLDRESKPQDGDTQADTIKTLQAYTKAAVDKAERLHEYTRSQSGQVTQNSRGLQKLENDNKELNDTVQKFSSRIRVLEDEVLTLKQGLKTAKRKKDQVGNGPITDIPVGFGFDQLPQRKQLGNPNVGEWYDSINGPIGDGKGNEKSGFSGLLSRSNRIDHKIKSEVISNAKQQVDAEVIEPMYTLAKDAVLTDAIAMTALIGRIPVDGKTPDPYPVKLFIGRENMLANGHDLPEIEGMIFSGLAIGDWNLSCVSARLYSASYIFTDGSIVNHSTNGEPLGYISDPIGVPCVSGKFVTNAPKFLLKRTGLAGLGTAGSAYAEAQQQAQTSALTGSTTRTISGDIDKLVAGNVVKSATDEVTEWLLKRQKQSFDAVVVNPGVSVAVHLDKELIIDHREYARKVRYGGNNENLDSAMD